MDELDRMIEELKYKFLEEKGVEGDSWEEFKAYAFAALDRDANLQAALQLACADEEAAKRIDEDSIPGDSVLERKRYFTRLTEHIERDIQGCSITAPAEPPEKFVVRMLREMPPPAGVAIVEAGQVDLVEHFGRGAGAARGGGRLPDANARPRRHARLSRGRRDVALVGRTRPDRLRPRRRCLLVLDD